LCNFVEEVIALSKSIRYTLALKGLKSPSGTISFGDLIDALSCLSESSQRALRFAVEGASTRTGPMPKWVAKSSEFLFRQIKKGSTVLAFDAPTLAETIGPRISQQDLWYATPDPEDTAVSMLSKALGELTAGGMESQRYDKGMLESIMSFRRFLEADGSQIILTESKKHRTLFSVDSSSLHEIDRVRAAFPDPQAVLVSGDCDMIEKSTRRFKLLLADGHTVLGRLAGDNPMAQNMRSLFGLKVTVRGTMNYMANGKPRLLEALMVRPFETGDSLFEEFVGTNSIEADVRGMRSTFKSGDILAGIKGRWPGDESIEELLEIIQEET
jgi:hypothetical protein